MTLIRDLHVDIDLCTDSYRRREWLLSKDYIRRFEMGTDVSIRQSTMKGNVLIQTLRDISEPDVVIGVEAQEAYANAEDWLCRRMCTLFQTVRGLGIQPLHFKKEVQFYQERVEVPVVGMANQLVWIPVAAFYVGDERIYLWRVAGQTLIKSGKVLDMHSTCSIGYTREYLTTLSPELNAYITRLESKAMQDEEVKAAFTRLGSILRPEQYKTEMLAERAKEYESVADFGGWA